MATNATDATDDINSDHDIDTEHEGSLSEVMCPNGKHKWKHDQCMVCGICGECSGKHKGPFTNYFYKSRGVGGQKN